MIKSSLAFLLTILTGTSVKLPEALPSDFTLNYHLDGGRVYYMEDIYISKDKCVFTKNEAGKKTEKQFTLTSSELNGLYAILQKNKFDKITSKYAEVYDRGGKSVKISWDKNTKFLEVRDTQRDFVNDKWQKNWNEICKFIEEMVARKS